MAIYEIIALLGLSQGLLVAFFILRNKIFSNSLNRYFAYFLLTLVIIGLDSLLSRYYHQLTPFWFAFFDIVGDDIPWIMMFYLPLFTFFLKATNTTISIPTQLFYIPFLVFVVINVIIDLDFDFQLISAPFFTNNRFLFYEFEDYIAVVLFLSLHLFIYFKAIRASNDKWIKNLWWYCTTIILIWIYLLFNHAFFEDQFLDVILALLWTSISVFIYWLIYTGLFQFNLANNRKMLKVQFDQSIPSQNGATSKPKIARSYFDKLEDLMEKEALYRDPDISREKIAEQLDISSGYLTQLIKEQMDVSFTAFINQYRVKEVEKMLQDSSFEHFDVLSIGLEAGFKSKSAFYSTFKKFNGLTPTQYRQKQS